MDWVVHKFGGTSLADAAGFLAAGGILEAQTDHRRAVIVSAMSGVTDELLALVELARSRSDGHHAGIEALRRRQLETIGRLVDGDRAERVAGAVESDLRTIEEVLRAIWLTRAAPASASDLIAGFGELWSARLLASLLRARGRSAEWLDAREILVVEPAPMAPAIVADRSAQRLESRLADTPVDVLVLPGFVASSPAGVPTTLGRNGSDYSASLFAELLGARSVTIWTDVDGVMSADPRRVTDAEVLRELSYDEAMELAYFGAKVIHPATMAPAVRRGIPIFIRNTFRPEAAGTRIRPVTTTDRPIKGLATIDAMALFNLEGTGMIGVPGVAERLFGALRAAGVSVTMISQGSSEHSICFVLPAAQADTARRAVEQAFLAERHGGRIQKLEVVDDCTVLAVVGDNMAGTPGIAGRFFGALGKAGVNVRAVAQGSSERNISIVIDSDDATRALRAVHSGFYLSEQTLSIGVVGPGLVGSTLLAQLASQSARLRDESGIDLRVRAIARRDRMLLDDLGIDPGRWERRLAREGEGGDLDRLAAHVHAESIPHAVILDCTASETVARRHLDWLRAGIHVVTPNKIANTLDLDYYRALRRGSHGWGTRYLYETTVGAGLPILQTLRDLIQTGDRVHRIEGILSGTLSFLFNAFDGSRPFSEILRDARERGYTEPDPRDDLGGTDVARKVVILAREMGLSTELGDVRVEGLLARRHDPRSVDEFLDDPDDLDAVTRGRLEQAHDRGEALRFVGSVDADGSAAVGLRGYPRDHPFARIRLTDNVVLFRTDRYRDNPLVVQGPGAGPDVTAGGVFADLLRLAWSLGTGR